MKKFFYVQYFGRKFTGRESRVKQANPDYGRDRHLMLLRTLGNGRAHMAMRRGNLRVRKYCCGEKRKNAVKMRAFLPYLCYEYLFS